MLNLKRLHQGDGEIGHLGEFFILLGTYVLGLGIAIVLYGYYGTHGAPDDAVTTGALFGVGGIGILVAGAVMILSGWGRHHPDFDSHDPKDPHWDPN